MNSSSIIGRIPPVTKNLLAVNILIWAVMALFPKVGFSLDNVLALYYIESPAFKPFQLLTYMFLHSSFTHLLFNMFALWMFGSVIERALGSKRFLIYYVSCGFGAALIQEGVFGIMVAKYHEMFSPEQFDQIAQRGLRFTQMIRYVRETGINNLSVQNIHDIQAFFDNPTIDALNEIVNTPVVGASGAIFGILLAFGMLFPNQPIYLMFIPIPLKAKWMVLGYGVLELFMGVSGVASNVAHWAHLGGMLVGVFMILYWKKRGDFNDRWYF